MEHHEIVIAACTLVFLYVCLASWIAWKWVRPCAWHQFFLCFLLGVFLFFSLLVVTLFLVVGHYVSHALHLFFSPLIDAVIFQ